MKKLASIISIYIIGFNLCFLPSHAMDGKPPASVTTIDLNDEYYMIVELHIDTSISSYATTKTIHNWRECF